MLFVAYSKCYKWLNRFSLCGVWATIVFSMIFRLDAIIEEYLWGSRSTSVLYSLDTGGGHKRSAKRLKFAKG